jgi:hypothetical protein
LEAIFFHRRAAEGAKSAYFLFAAYPPKDRRTGKPANKKIQALRAKGKTNLRIAWFRNNVKFISPVF